MKIVMVKIERVERSFSSEVTSDSSTVMDRDRLVIVNYELLW
jgi:hypothetical protein